jgi:hypothetical protein
LAFLEDLHVMTYTSTGLREASAGPGFYQVRLTGTGTRAWTTQTEVATASSKEVVTVVAIPED